MNTNKIEFEIPETCGDCIFYRRNQYQCHNEIGWEATCHMGYMEGKDMREARYGKKKFEGCRLHEKNQLIPTIKGFNHWRNE